MAGTKNTTLRNTLADAFAGVINRLIIEDSSNVTLAIFSLTWGSASSGAVTASSPPQTVTASATGTADHAKLYHSSGSDDVDSLTVGTSGTDVIIDSTAITSGQSVQLNSLSWTVPASTA